MPNLSAKTNESFKTILKHEIKRAKRNKAAYAFIAPYFILFSCFTVLPVLMSIFYSFTDYNMLQTPSWVGFANYIRLAVKDDIFITSIKNTFVFAVIVGPAGYIMSLLVAWFLNELSKPLRAMMVVIFYAPAISGNAYLVWKILFSSDSTGYINGILMRLSFINEPIHWLQNPKYMLGVCIVVSLWMSLGTTFLSFVAGLQGIDRALYEAGAMDGVRNRWQELWYITLPSMRPQLLFGSVMSITSALSVSDVSISLCGYPSVQYGAHTMVTHLLDYGNIRFEMGYASAIATVLFFIMVGTSKLVNRFIRSIGT